MIQIAADRCIDLNDHGQLRGRVTLGKEEAAGWPWSSPSPRATTSATSENPGAGQGELAARRLGVDAELVAAQLRDRARDAHQQATRGGLRLDQAAAVWHVLTSARTVEVVTGPAGTGKTRVLATAARAWGGPVSGTATSQHATNELRNAGVRVAANTTRLLADLDSIPPGSLIEVDEGSMVSLAHLAALTEHAARNGCKLVLAGDQEQLAAVEGGGAMMLLADRLGYGAPGRWPDFCPDHAHQRVLNLGTCSAKLVLILYGHADRTRTGGACPACAS